MTAREWAETLGLFYAPSLLFFDEQGEEVIRVSSVVRVYRLRGVLEYVLSKGYLQAPTYQRWRESQGIYQ
jgi:thioredoxin-related protein